MRQEKGGPRARPLLPLETAATREEAELARERLRDSNAAFADSLALVAFDDEGMAQDEPDEPLAAPDEGPSAVVATYGVVERRRDRVG
jgi:hypothetical protein